MKRKAHRPGCGFAECDCHPTHEINPWEHARVCKDCDPQALADRCECPVVER